MILDIDRFVSVRYFDHPRNFRLWPTRSDDGAPPRNGMAECHGLMKLDITTEQTAPEAGFTHPAVGTSPSFLVINTDVVGRVASGFHRLDCGFGMGR